MQFFEQYFTKHHFFHSPHKWFLALLISPIHFFEQRYKTRYHLNYENAKKLFFFDLGLMFTIIILIITTIFWFTYRPGIAYLIDLKITASPERLKSGDYTTFNIYYKNNSGKKITDATLTVELPKNFVLDKVSNSQVFATSTNTFNLNQINNGGNGNLEINGWFYGIPEQEVNLVAHLNYHQENQSYSEAKAIPLFQILRGSTLSGAIEMNPQILNQGITPIKIMLTNNGQLPLPEINLPFVLPTGLAIKNSLVDFGEVKDNHWIIKNLPKEQTATLKGELISNLGKISSINLELMPTILINNNYLNQTPIKKTLDIIKPEIALSQNWESETTNPGQTKKLTITLNNLGTITLNNLQLSLALPKALINNLTLAKENNGTYQNENLILNKEQWLELKSLKPGETKNLTLNIPINNNPEGEQNLTLNANVRLSAQVGTLNNAIFETVTTGPALKIGTQIIGTGEVRYYTEDGIQLGRGPLPPEVGKETKYGVLLHFKNTSSELSKVKLSVELPTYIKWTGKSSVSLGKAPYALTNKIYWETNILNPFENAGIYLELAITPSAEQINITPIILKNIQITGHDTFIDKDITTHLNDLDISLPNDKLAKQKGTIIQ